MLIEITLRAEEAAADPLAEALLAQGALAVSLEDAEAESAQESPLFGEPGCEPGRQAWSQTRLRVLLDDRAGDVQQRLNAVCATIAVPACVIETSREVVDEDWVRTTQAQFPPTRISGRLWIVPTWHEPPDVSAVNVRLDPGVAFGTGTHATTQLCLQWLDEQLRPGDRVLDYGCGSGILAIAAGRLGAATVVGVDIDEQALSAARANSTANAVTARYTGPDQLGSGQYDVVIANILSNPLKVLAPALLARVATGGALVLSGVLERQAEEVLASYRGTDAAVGLSIWRTLEGWVCLAGRRAG